MATISLDRGWNRTLILLVAGAILLNYVDRGTIGVAAPLLKGDLGLSATGFGLAVSAFFWVYAPIQFLIGWLCDRVCVYRLFGAGLALWALSTTLTALVGGLVSLVLLRLLLGLGESIAFPGSTKIIARHVPADRRGMANAAVAAALALGPAIGTLGGGLILTWFGWRLMFAVSGLVTFLWLEPWRRTIRPLLGESVAAAETPFPISRLVRLRALWVMSAGHFAGNIGFYLILAWLPLYLVKSRGYSLVDMTMLATACYSAQAASALLVGWTSDRLIARGGSEGPVRRRMLVFGYALSAASILGIATAGSFPALLLWLLLAGAATGFGSVNLYAVGQIFSGPRAAGSWMGIQNAIGNFAGIVGPVMTGLIIDGTGSYTSAFVLTAAIVGAGALLWLFALPTIERVALD